jgi:hypothetical protein
VELFDSEGCEAVLENLLTNAKNPNKSLKQIKYLIRLGKQTNQAFRLNKQTKKRPDFCLICLFTPLGRLAERWKRDAGPLVIDL